MTVKQAGRFLFQRKLVDSPCCAFCKDAEDTILYMFWECPKVQGFWLEVQGWLHKHCTNITFPKELIILGVRANLATDRIIDLCILIAKYHIFTSKLQDTTPHLYAFVQNMKNSFEVEKYYYIVNSRPNNFTLIGYHTNHTSPETGMYENVCYFLYACTPLICVIMGISTFCALYVFL